jgi:hypothetical protein
MTVATVTKVRYQRPELPKPWLPLAPPVSSVDSVTGPVNTGVGTNCAILSPDRISYMSARVVMSTTISPR